MCQSRRVIYYHNSQMNLFYLIIGTLISINYNFVETSNDLPPILNACKRSDTNLNKCIWDNIEKIQPNLIDGIPSLNVPPMDPLFLPLIKVDQSAGPIYLESEYKNVEVRGVTNFTLKNVHVNLEKNLFTLKTHFPALNVTSDYSINGKILIMPIAGAGKFKANFTDVTLTCDLIGERYKYKKNGRPEEDYFKVNNIKMNFVIGGSRTHLNNLFNGDPLLEKTMNRFLNDNWRLISNEIKPILQEILSKILKEMIDDFFILYSYDRLFPK